MRGVRTAAANIMSYKAIILMVQLHIYHVNTKFLTVKLGGRIFNLQVDFCAVWNDLTHISVYNLMYFNAAVVQFRVHP